MAPSFRHIALLALTIPLSLAVPTPELQYSLGNDRTICQPTTVRTSFKRLRDFLIESIWSVPKESRCHRSVSKSDHTAPHNFRKKYGGEVVLRFKIKTQEEGEAFLKAANILYLDVWDASSEWIDVRVSKDVLPSFLNLLPTSLQTAHTPLMHDLAQSVYDTFPSNTDHESWRSRHSPVQKSQTNLFFESYQPRSVIYPWMQLVASLFPNHTNSISIGKSAEGRDIPALRIGAPIPDQKPNKHVRGRETILVVGGQHAREWISVSTVSYLAYQFATRYDSSSDIKKILRHFDVIFVPVLNPDGYEYTWTNDRLWRKNRQSTSMPFCPGIDLDRAYPFQWDGQQEADNPCGDTYAGQFAFQAVEAKALADWAFSETRDNDRVFTGYLDLHSYSQQVLYPFSYNCNKEPSNLENLMEVALGMKKAFRTSSGSTYTIGASCGSPIVATNADNNDDNNKQKPQSFPGRTNGNGGSSLDYFYAMMRVEYSFQIKLRDTGTYGFLLPKEQIVPQGKEMLQALVNMGKWLVSNRGMESIPVDESPGGEEIPFVEEGMDLDNESSDWEARQPSSLFKVSENGYQDDLAEEKQPGVVDDDDEWERVYDEELRKRR